MSLTTLSPHYRPLWWSSDAEAVGRRFRAVLRLRFGEDDAVGLEEAQRIAEQGHAGQTRAGGEPYLVHPLRVALSLILEFGVRDRALIEAALLHDVLEDSATDPLEIAARFGPKVRRIVESLTRQTKRSAAGDRLHDAYLQALVAGGQESILVKLADKIDNLRDAIHHPRLERRRLYVEEGYKTYFLLAERLQNQEIREQALALLSQAMQEHSFYRPYLAWRHYTARLAARFRDLAPGNHLLFGSLAEEIHRLDRCIEIFLLQNPRPPFWLTSDGVQVVKIALDPEALAANVADLIAAKLRHGGVGELLALASLPAFLAADFKRSDWQQVLHQLDALVALLRSPDRPSWLRPLLADTRWLLAVIHSRLFLPSSWSFPLWHPDFGASLVGANDELFQETCDADEARRHRHRVELLLRERLAVWRFYTGAGSRKRFLGLLQALEGAASSGESGWTVLAARVLAEYLEVLAVGDREERNLREEFTALWNDSRLPDAASARPVGTASDAELLGLSRLRAVSREKGAEDKLLDLVRFVLGEGEKAGAAESRWIALDVAEILKRQEDFFAALRLLPAEPRQRDLDRLGFRFDENRFGTTQVLTIRPGPALALRNRLPEATEEELEEIAHGKFAATVIFDVLLRRKLAVSPLWTPRAFRILDSIADLDPENVQPVSISLESSEPGKPLDIGLPLPARLDTARARAEQEERKAIVARFVAVMIYNSAIATSVESARVQCAILDPERREAGFSTGELVEHLAQIASRHGYEAYGHFVQGFNFRPFTVTPGGPADESVPFAGADLSYGAFLGIDIGGTDIKMCLFEGAEPSRHPLRTISTFEDDSEGVPVLRFVDRILDEAERYLEGRLSLQRLDGIGISWPGAVRDAKIVGYSRTLGRLQLPVAGHLRTLGPDASPQDIQSADLVRFFHQRVRERGVELPEPLAIAIENDGNAEAYGNYCLIEMQGAQVPGAKVVIKLGTSLAGGHIDASGAISAHVSEFSKVVLDFSQPPQATAGVFGTARDWVSSKAVRALSRSFVFDGEVVFGPLDGLNASDDAGRRLEAVEIGELLNLWLEVDEEPLRENAFLRELVEADNLRAGGRAAELRQRLATAQGPGPEGASPALEDYVYRRGCERYTAERKVAKDRVWERTTAARKGRLAGASLPATDEKLLAAIWRLGLERLLLLVEGRSTQGPANDGELPAELDRDRLAAKVLGAVGLVSQLGLQTAHLVVVLYNLYRKERMKGVILAGGVLAGATGHIVRAQTERFLLKYYDKVFGPAKNLTPDSIRLAQSDEPAVVGPLGAAMSANRLHRIQTHRTLQQIIHHAVERLAPGETLRLEEMVRLTAGLRGNQAGLIACLDELVAASRLLPLAGQEGSYLKM